MKETTNAHFEADVLQAQGLVLVDFYAPWCGPCKMLAPLLDQLATQYAGRATLIKLNVDDAPELANQYRITGVPTLMLFRQGKVLDTIVGMASPSAIRSALDRALQAEPQPAVAKA